jgi:Spy/CpxP family protein refolding chaperone
MKTTIKTGVVIALIMISAAARSQVNPGFPRIRHRIIQAKLQEIRHSLKLEQAEMEKFRPMYVRYEEEISSLNFRGQERLMRVNSDSLTAEEAETMVLKQLQNARRIINIREKYYHEFKKILTPQQIIRLYQTEAEIRRKVMQEMRHRFGRRFGE